MREILFRGKTSNNIWIYGNLNYYPDINRTFIRKNDKKLCPSMQSSLEEEVSKKTVGQYTGLTDKNGKKIFEGDILKYINEDDELHYITVVFDECAFLIDDQGIIDSDLLTSYTCLGIEVVGNVIDNPELMEGAGQ